jgi:hypothetical protein
MHFTNFAKHKPLGLGVGIACVYGTKEAYPSKVYPKKILPKVQ